jgi:3-oxoacyl-[acyl-carrier-protein] synthase III
VRPKDLYVAGLGVYLPATVSTASAVEDGRYPADERELAGWESVAVAGDLAAPDMAVVAARQALSQCPSAATEVALFLYATTFHQGPDGWTPQHYVQRETTGGDQPAFEVRQGCNGLVGALELAACYLQADDSRTAAMIAAADNYGAPLVDRWRSITNVVLGDAATAVMLSTRGGFVRVLSIVGGSAPELEFLHRGDEPLYPPGATVNTVVDLRGRAAQFGTGGSPRQVPDGGLIGNLTAKVVKRALADADVDVSSIRRVTHVHWGHERYLRRTLVPLGLTVEQGMLDFGRRVGHLGPSDQFAGLHHLLDTAAVGAGDLVMMIGVGPGLSVACAIVEVLGELPGPVMPAVAS